MIREHIPEFNNVVNKWSLKFDNNKDEEEMFIKNRLNPFQQYPFTKYSFILFSALTIGRSIEEVVLAIFELKGYEATFRQATLNLIIVVAVSIIELMFYLVNCLNWLRGCLLMTASFVIISYLNLMNFNATSMPLMVPM